MPLIKGISHEKTTSHKAARRPAKHTDLYRQITDRIVVALENGVAPWRKPWRAAAGSGLAGLPLNATTGRHYSGVNVLLLWMSAEEQGFRNNRWMTYRQAQQAGGRCERVRKPPWRWFIRTGRNRRRIAKATAFMTVTVNR
jgi:antirestriction protein ArdC